MSTTQRRPTYNFFGTPPGKSGNVSSAAKTDMHPESPLSRPHEHIINSSARKFGSLLGLQEEATSFRLEAATGNNGTVDRGINRQLLPPSQPNESISSMDFHHTVVPPTSTIAPEVLSTSSNTTSIMRRISFLRDARPILVIDEINSSLSGAPLFNPLGGGGILTSNTQSMNSPELISLKTKSSSSTFNSSALPVTNNDNSTSRSDGVFAPPEERRMTVAPLRTTPRRERHFVDPTAQEELCDGINDFHCDAYYNGLLRYQRRDDAQDSDIIKTKATYEKCMSAVFGGEEGSVDGNTTPKSQDGEDVEDILCSLVESTASPSTNSNIVADSGVVFERQYSKTGRSVFGISQPMGGTESSCDEDDDMITLNTLMAMTADAPDLSYLHRFQNSVSMALTTDALKLTQNTRNTDSVGLKPRYLLGNIDEDEEEEEELDDISTSASSCISSPDFKNNDISSSERFQTTYLGDPHMVLTSIRRSSLTSSCSTAGHKSPTWATTTSNRIPLLSGGRDGLGSGDQEVSEWGKVVDGSVKKKHLTANISADVGSSMLTLALTRRISLSSSIATTIGHNSSEVDPPASDGATPSPHPIQRIASWHSKSSAGAAGSGSISSGDANTSSQLPAMLNPGAVGSHPSPYNNPPHQLQQQHALSTMPKAAIPVQLPLRTASSTPASGLEMAALHQHYNGDDTTHRQHPTHREPPTDTSIILERKPSPSATADSITPVQGPSSSAATSPTPSISVIGSTSNGINANGKPVFEENPTTTSQKGKKHNTTNSSSSSSSASSSDENGFDEDPLVYWGLAGISRKGSAFQSSRAPSAASSGAGKSTMSLSAITHSSIVDSLTNYSSLSSPPLAISHLQQQGSTNPTKEGKLSPSSQQQADTPKKNLQSSDNNSRYLGSGSVRRRTPSATTTPHSSMSSHGNTFSGDNHNNNNHNNSTTATSGDFSVFLKVRGVQDHSLSLPAYSDELDATGSDSSDDDGIVHDVVLGGSFRGLPDSEASSPHNSNSQSISGGGGSKTTTTKSSTTRESGVSLESPMVAVSRETLLRSFSPELQPLGQQHNNIKVSNRLRSNSPSDYDEPFRPFTSSSTASSSNKRTTIPGKLDEKGEPETSVFHLPEELRASALNNITRNLNHTGASTPTTTSVALSSNTASQQQQARERSKGGITSPLPESGGGAFLFGDVIVDMNNEIFVSKKATKSLRESMALSGSLRRCTVQRCAGQRASIRALAFLTHDESIFAVSAAEPYSLVRKQYGSIYASRKGLETHGAPCRPVLSGAYTVTPKAALPTYPRPYLGAASGATTYQELPRSQLHQTSSASVISSSPHGRTDPKNSVVSEGFATAFNGFFAVDMAALMAMVRLVMGTSAETYLLAHCVKKQQQDYNNQMSPEVRSTSLAVDGSNLGLGIFELGVSALHVGQMTPSPAFQDNGGVAPESSEMKLAHIFLWLRSQVARVMHFYSASQFQSRISGSATPLGSTGVSFPLSYRSLVSAYEMPPLINFRTANGIKELIRSSTHRSTASMTDIHRRHMLRQLVPYGQNLGSDPLEESVIVGIMAGHGAAVNHITVSSDMRFVATSSGDGMLIVYDAVTYKRIAGCSHPAEVRCSSFSKNGKYIVTGCADSGCRLWPTKKNHATPVSSYFGHSAPITTISFQVVSGDFVVSGSEDGAVHLWNAASGKPVRDFRNHRKPVIYTAFAHIPITSLTKQNGMEVVEVPPPAKKTTSNGKKADPSTPVDLNCHFIITADAVSVVLMEVTASAMQGSQSSSSSSNNNNAGVGDDNNSGGCPVLGIADLTAFFHGEVVSNRRVASHSRSNVPGHPMSDHSSGSPFSTSSLNINPSSNSNTTFPTSGSVNSGDATILPIIPVHQRRSLHNRDGLDRTQVYARGNSSSIASKNQPPPTVEIAPTPSQKQSSNTARNARASALRAALAVDDPTPLQNGGGSQLPTITSVQLAPQKTFPLCFFIARSDRVVSLFQFQLVESKDATTLQPKPPSSSPATGSANPRATRVGVGGRPSASSSGTCIPPIRVQARLSQEVWSTCSSGEVLTMAAGPFNSVLCGDSQGNVFKIRLEQFERQRLEVEERQKKMTRMMPSAGERMD